MVEEPVVDADALQAEDAREDPADDLLAGVARAAGGEAAGEVRLGQRDRSSLPFGVSGMASSTTIADGTM